MKFLQKATVAADCPFSTRLCRGVNTRGGGLPHFQTVTFTSCPAYKAWNSVSFPKLLHLLGKTERTGRREHHRWPSHRVSWLPSTQISINVAFSQKRKQTQNVGWRQGASGHRDSIMTDCNGGADGNWWVACMTLAACRVTPLMLALAQRIFWGAV